MYQGLKEEQYFGNPVWNVVGGVRGMLLIHAEWLDSIIFHAKIKSSVQYCAVGKTL